MEDDRPAGEAELYAFFERHGIGWSHHTHPPLHTVEESRALRGQLPGLHVKNMFMKDKKGRLVLATCLEDRRFRIRDLEREIGCKGLSFGKPELLWDALGVHPGAVTPFALLNDPDRQVEPVLDRALTEGGTVNAHPLHNQATTAISSEDLLRFFALTGHQPRIVDFDRLEELERGRVAEG